MAVSGQRPRKHVPVATDTNATEEVFSMWFVPRCYKQGTRLEFSSVRESVKRGRGITIVGAVTRTRLVTENTRLCSSEL
jgi:hypothetical protein